jgi:hypothetical protein
MLRILETVSALPHVSSSYDSEFGKYIALPFSELVLRAVGFEIWRLTENNKKPVEATEMDALRRSGDPREYQEKKELKM